MSILCASPTGNRTVRNIDNDANDFFFYLDAFANGDLNICDIDQDADCDAEDLFAYLDLFAAGC